MRAPQLASVGILAGRGVEASSLFSPSTYPAKPLLLALSRFNNFADNPRNSLFCSITGPDWSLVEPHNPSEYRNRVESSW